MTRVLVTGGVRSGKSAHAQSLVGGEQDPVTYVAAGPRRDDEDWARRVQAHRDSRPAGWTTLEPAAHELPAAIRDAEGPVLVDCLGTWLTGALDDLGAWDSQEWHEQWAQLSQELVSSVADANHPVVLVSNEVGWALVSEYRSGRIFADELGRLNQRVAAVCDDVVLVVAGQPLNLKQT